MYTYHVVQALAPVMEAEGIRCPHAQHLAAEIATAAIELLRGRYVTSGHHVVERRHLEAIIASYLASYSPAGAALNPGRLHED